MRMQKHLYYQSPSHSAYYNRASIGYYVADTCDLPKRRKPPKQAQFPDVPGWARTYSSKLVMSRKAVRVRSSALLFTCKYCKKVEYPARSTGGLAAVGQQ